MPPTLRPRYDIVVVGAGVFGLSSAYHLHRAHPSETMLVLDARSGPGEGSTGASAAMVRNVFTSSDNRHLANSSIDFYRSIQEGGEDLELDLYGYLWLLGREATERFGPHVADFGPGVARGVDRNELSSVPGLNLTPVGEAASLMELPAIDGGILGHKCGSIAPEKLCGFYYRHLKEEGVEFLFDTAVARLRFDDRTIMDLGEDRPYAWQEHIPGRVRAGSLLLARGQEVGAGTIVLAAGAWAPELLDPLGIDGVARPRARQLFALPSGSLSPLLSWRGRFESLFGATASCPFLILPTGTYLKPLRERREFWVGHADYAGLRFGTQEHLDPEGLGFDPRLLGRTEYYLGHVGPMVSEYLPALAGVRPTSGWGGYYGTTPDGLPYIFEQNGVLVVVGDSGSGVMKADAVGRVATAVYGGHWFATLHGGTTYDASHLGYSERNVEVERFII